MKKNLKIASMLNRYLTAPVEQNEERQESSRGRVSAPSSQNIFAVIENPPNQSFDNIEPVSEVIDNQSESSEEEEEKFQGEGEGGINLIMNAELQADAAPSGNQLYEYGNIEYWTNTIFPWTDHLLASLMQHFDIDNFRPIQKAAINATLSKRDVFLCIPTGSGKSLTFQLPAILNKGVTVVFMPLIALMQDQTNQLKAKNIPVLNLSGQEGLYMQSKFPSIIKQFRESLDHDESAEKTYPRIIFLSPEKIAMNEATVKLLHEIYDLGLIERFVIDEAHCVSMWGREFRKEYLNLNRLKTEFPGVPTLAMTATATEDYREDIIKQLGMQNVLYFQNSFNRENLIFEVQVKNKRDEILQIERFINENYPNQSGIIYVTCRNDAERVCQALIMRYNMRCGFYHAKMDDKMRKDVQNAWMRGEINIIVATIAFGMGINKPDVRFVIHYNLAKSLAHYYQEAGRAGRDGLDSHCVIFYDPNDRLILEYFIATSESTPEAKRDACWELYKMIQYCESLYACRRVTALAYFGEVFDKAECKGYCDNCETNREEGTTVDMTLTAQMIARVLEQTRKGARMEEFPRMLLGIGKKYEGKRILDISVSREEVQEVIKAMILKKYIHVDYRVVDGKRRQTFDSRVSINPLRVGFLYNGQQKLELSLPLYSAKEMKKQLTIKNRKKNKKPSNRNNQDQNQNQSQSQSQGRQFISSQFPEIYPENNRNRDRNNDDDDLNGFGNFPMQNSSLFERIEINHHQDTDMNNQRFNNNNNNRQEAYQRDYNNNGVSSSYFDEEEEKRNQPFFSANREGDEGNYQMENNNNNPDSNPRKLGFLGLLSKFDTLRGNLSQNAPLSQNQSQAIPLMRPNLEDISNRINQRNANENSQSQGLKRRYQEEDNNTQIRDKKLKFTTD